MWWRGPSQPPYFSCYWASAWLWSGDNNDHDYDDDDDHDCDDDDDDDCDDDDDDDDDDCVTGWGRRGREGEKNLLAETGR